MRKEKSQCSKCGIYRYKFIQGICDPCFNKQRRLESQLIKCQCDPNCQIMIYSIGYHGEKKRFAQGHASKLRTGLKAVNYKNGISLSKEGYLMIYKPYHPYCNHQGYIRLHRIIKEIYLSIKYGYPVYINPNLDIHHINHNILDNRPKNLQILSKKDHGYYHGKYRKGMKYNKKYNPCSTALTLQISHNNVYIKQYLRIVKCTLKNEKSKYFKKIRYYIHYLIFSYIGFISLYFK